MPCWGARPHRTSLTPRAAKSPVLEIRDLKLIHRASPFSMTLGSGEIVAVTGLVGVGKSVLVETIFGLAKPVCGQMKLDGQTYAPQSPWPRRSAPASILVAKDRAANGIVPGFSIFENISLPFLKRMSRFDRLSRSRERASARGQIGELGSSAAPNETTCRRFRAATSKR